MWKLEDLLSIKYPYNWELQGVYSTVNGLTLDMYLKKYAQHADGTADRVRADRR